MSSLHYAERAESTISKPKTHQKQKSKQEEKEKDCVEQRNLIICPWSNCERRKNKKERSLMLFAVRKRIHPIELEIPPKQKCWENLDRLPPSHYTTIIVMTSLFQFLVPLFLFHLVVIVHHPSISFPHSHHVPKHRVSSSSSRL